MNISAMSNVMMAQRRRCCSLIAQGWRAKVLSTLGYNHLKSDKQQTILLALSLKQHCHLLLSHLFGV